MEGMTVKELKKIAGLKKAIGGIDVERLGLIYNGKIIVRLSFHRNNVVEYRDIDNNIFGTFQDTAYLE